MTASSPRPAAPDTTGGELREALAQWLFRRVMDREGKRKLQWEHLESWTQDGWLGWADDLTNGPLRDLLAERDTLAAQVQAVEGLHTPVDYGDVIACRICADESGEVEPWPCETSRALGTPTTGGGE